MENDRTPVHVLIVDDDHGTREVLRLMLEDEGHTVHEARDGVDALDVLRTSPHAFVVLTDHNMPRLDGPGLFGFIRDDPQLAERHVYIYMTASNRVLHPGFYDQLMELDVPIMRKPFECDDVVDTVAQAAKRIAVLSSAGANTGEA